MIPEIVDTVIPNADNKIISKALVLEYSDVLYIIWDDHFNSFIENPIEYTSGRWGPFFQKYEKGNLIYYDEENFPCFKSIK